MAACAGARTAGAVAWLQDQLRSERQHMQTRHDSMLMGLEALLGQHADTADGAEVATGVLSSQPRAVTNGSARAAVSDIIDSMDALDSEAHNTEFPQVRNAKELTEEALHERGLDLEMAANRSERPSTHAKDQVAGDSSFSSFGTRACLVWALVQFYSQWIVSSRMFDYCMGVVIVSNCVCIGLEINATVDGSEAALELQVLERVFLISYLVELTMRIIGGWKTCWFDSWFQLDLVLVILGLLSIWVLGSVGASDVVAGILNKVLLIRILRLVRLVRALRFLRFMQPLWKLISGLLGSIHTVVSAALLLFGSMYVFACAGVSLFAQDELLQGDDETGPIIDEHFQSVPLLMLTLIQFTTCDSVAQIYHPLIKVKPIMILYFLPIILVVPISLMNLITAVIVDHAVKASAVDAQLERCRLRGRLKELIPVLNKVFTEFDVSNDGKIDLSELDLTMMSNTLPSEVLDVLKSHKLKEFFEYLDADASGQIDQNEWVDGMCCLVLNEVPIENLQMLHLLSRTEAENGEMLHLLSRTASDVEALRAVVVPDAAADAAAALPDARRPGGPQGALA